MHDRRARTCQGRQRLVEMLGSPDKHGLASFDGGAKPVRPDRTLRETEAFGGIGLVEPVAVRRVAEPAGDKLAGLVTEEQGYSHAVEAFQPVVHHTLGRPDKDSVRIEIVDEQERLRPCRSLHPIERRQLCSISGATISVSCVPSRRPRRIRCPRAARRASSGTFRRLGTVSSPGLRLPHAGLRVRGRRRASAYPDSRQQLRRRARRR